MKRLVFAALLAPTLALAQTSAKPQGGAKYEPKTVIRFGEEGPIEVGRKGPDIEIVTSDGKAVHNSVIKLRENFDREVLNSVKELP